jgi:hypothetical protein
MNFFGYCIDKESYVSEKTELSITELYSYVESNRHMPVIYLLNQYGNVELVFREGQLSYIKDPTAHKQWIHEMYKVS